VTEDFAAFLDIFPGFHGSLEAVVMTFIQFVEQHAKSA
jgi:hypothetical protein